MLETILIGLYYYLECVQHVTSESNKLILLQHVENAKFQTTSQIYITTISLFPSDMLEIVFYTV